MPLFFLPMPPSTCPLLFFFTLSLAISLSLPFLNAGACSWSVFLTLKTGRVSHRREAEGEEAREEAAMAAGLCNMQSRALVAKVSGLRWGVSAARVHWCMNAAKSNASLDRQEGVGKVKAACRGRAAVHRHQGATFSPSITLPFLSLLFLLSCSTYLFISPYFFISNSVLWLSFCAMEEATALTRHSGHKERATEIKRRNAATHKILAYPWGIPTKLIPSEPNPSVFTPHPSHLLSFFFFSPRPLPRCYGVLFINMCKSLFLSTRGVTSTGPCRRLTPPLRFIAWALSPESDDRAGTERPRVKSVCKRKKNRGSGSGGEKR